MSAEVRYRDMNQQLSPTPSYAAQQQLQGILVELADIERRLRRVNLVVANIASELGPAEPAEATSSLDYQEAQVHAALVKPRSADVVRTLAQANRRAEQLARLAPSELREALDRSLQQAQSDALAQGIAIHDELEAARGD